jgi:hypothetical protein
MSTTSQCSQIIEIRLSVIKKNYDDCFDYVK